MRPGASLFQGGLGCGKSEAGAQKTIVLHLKNNASGKCCWSLAAAPTNSDLGRIVIPKLLTIAKRWGLRADYFPTGNKQFPFKHILIANAPIILLSAESPERWVGFECGVAWLDECARIYEHDDPTQNVWIQVNGRLRCPKAISIHLILTSTAEGTFSYQYKRFFKKDISSGPMGDDRFYKGKTTSNPYLKPEDVERIKSAIPKALVDAYINGETVDFAAHPAHPGFGPLNYKQIDLSKMLGGTFHIGCDYNVDNMGWVLGYHHLDIIYIIDEVVIEKDGQVDKMVHLCHNKGWARNRHIKFHVDKSSNARTVAAPDPIFHQMMKTARSLGWSCSGSADGANPEVADRIDLVNMCIEDANNKRHFFVDETRCPTLIRFLQGHPRKPDGKYSKTPVDPNILDAMGYLVFDLFKPKAGFSYLPRIRP